MVAFNESGKYRRVFCTTFNVEAIQKVNFDELVEHGPVRYVHLAFEIAPTTGRAHYHLYIEFKRQMTYKKIKKMFDETTMNIEPAFGTAKDSDEYFKKESTVWSRKYGRPSQQGARTDMEDIYERLKVGEDLLDVISEHPGSGIRYFRGLVAVKSLLDQKRQRAEERLMPEVIVYLGKSGSGKSHHCWNDPDYQRSGYKYPVQQNGKVYFDGYGGEAVLWFDEFGGSVLPFNVFLRLADKYETRVETKGGSVCIIGLRKILISTTVFPKDWWPESRKFLQDPRQLWRRLTTVFYIPSPSWGFGSPVRVERPDLFDEVGADYLERQAEMERPELARESVGGEGSGMVAAAGDDDESTSQSDPDRTIDSYDSE